MIGKEINLIKNYPKTKRDLNKRREGKTRKHRIIARKFEKFYKYPKCSAQAGGKDGNL